MNYYIYNHTIDEIDFTLNLKTVKEPTIQRVLASHLCLNCGTQTIGKWEFPTYNIPRYVSEDSFGLNIKVSPYELNDIIYNYFCTGKIFNEDKIYKNSKEGDKVFLDVRQDLTIASKQIPKFIRNYRNETLDFLRMEKCPICGKKYPVETDCCNYYTGRGRNEFYGEKEDNFLRKKTNTTYSVYKNEEIPSSRLSVDNIVEKEWKRISNIKFRKIINKLDGMEIEPIDEIEINDLKILKNYLNDIIKIEKEIYLVTNRLKELYYIDTQKEKVAFVSKTIPSMNLKNQLEKLEKEYKCKVNIKPQIKIKDIPFDVKKPEKPIAPVKPQTPILRKPGLFNKKKVAAENEWLMKSFEKAMSDYETYCSVYKELSIKYKAELEAYHKKEEEFKKEQEEKCQLEIKRLEELHKKECEDLKAEYEKLLAQYENSINSSDAIITKESVIATSVHNEVVLAEELLENLYKARKKAYAYGVIFEKYRNFVAVSMFYEYLSSGRCSELEGANGAYNLYESELRANIIISKLTEINKHLKDIKRNQFMIYSAVSEATNQLSSLNSSMNTMIKSLDRIDSHLTGIEKNTKLIAHNTEVAAFYAKKNAELTNALGYMIALK